MHVQVVDTLAKGGGTGRARGGQCGWYVGWQRVDPWRSGWMAYRPNTKTVLWHGKGGHGGEGEGDRGGEGSAEVGCTGACMYATRSSLC